MLGKRGRAKKIITVKQESIVEEKVKRPYKPRQKKGNVLFFISHKNYLL